MTEPTAFRLRQLASPRRPPAPGSGAVRPAAAFLGMFTFMTSWNDFLWPLVVLDAGNPTVQVALEQLQSGYYIDYSLVLAGTTLATIPIVIVFVVLGRQIVAGIMQGAVKG